MFGFSFPPHVLSVDAAEFWRQESLFLICSVKSLKQGWDLVRWRVPWVMMVRLKHLVRCHCGLQRQQSSLPTVVIQLQRGSFTMVVF